ncbi:glycoside hydrolase family 2 protein [bacterium D16-51]|nr:glycoside hydrolase family 2 protein [bacterium D16-59]RKI52938.1 glycoside hydrolase family 2 protein [bacterium D16-51]
MTDTSWTVYCCACAGFGFRKEEDLVQETVIEKRNSQTMLTLDLDAKWKFSKIGVWEEEIAEAVAPEFDDSLYETVSLPHTWNAEDGTCGKEGICYRGNGLYRKRLMLSYGEWGQKTVYLSFEGANTVAVVYVNGSMAGRHEGGYSGFRIDITDYLIWGQENVIAVLVDNSETAYIAPIGKEGDFTKFGGIYRDVFLLGVDDVSFNLIENGADGVFVSPVLSEDGREGNVKIHAALRNASAKQRQLNIFSVLKDREGIEVARGSISLKMEADSVKEVEYFIGIANPHLWNGVRDPYLYIVDTCLVLEGEVLQNVITETGFRRYDIFGNQFYLNGQPYNIHGVNYHQDSSASGWAMTDEEREADYAMMIDMGVTAVRMAHYQHDPYEYQLCDRIGLVVYTEIPLINRAFSEEFFVDRALFAENIKQQLTELVCQNYNHPSICFWGISNELYDTDCETSKLYTELCRLALSLDGTRMTIYADNQAGPEYVKRSCAADLVGYNRYDGWYYGEAGGICSWVADRQEEDSRPSCISEYGAGGAVTQHMDLPGQNDIIPNGELHYEEYQAIFHEKAWKDIVLSKNVWGEFIWCMFDFASDSREEGDTKGQNDKGLVTRDRKVKKDAYYFYQSVWGSKKMVHITSSRYQMRPCHVPEIKVYSNAETVELFLNGKSAGVRNARKEEGCSTIFTWENIKLLQGRENVIKAVAVFCDGSQEIDCVSHPSASGGRW